MQCRIDHVLQRRRMQKGLAPFSGFHRQMGERPFLV